MLSCQQLGHFLTFFFFCFDDDDRHLHYGEERKKKGTTKKKVKARKKKKKKKKKTNKKKQEKKERKKKKNEHIINSYRYSIHHINPTRTRHRLLHVVLLLGTQNVRPRRFKRARLQTCKQGEPQGTFILIPPPVVLKGQGKLSLCGNCTSFSRLLRRNLKAWKFMT